MTQVSINALLRYRSREDKLRTENALLFNAYCRHAIRGRHQGHSISAVRDVIRLRNGDEITLRLSGEPGYRPQAVMYHNTEV